MTYQIVHTEPEPPSKHRSGSPGDRRHRDARASHARPARALPGVGPVRPGPGAELEAGAAAPGGSRGARHMRFTALRGLAFFKDFPEEELWEVLQISKWASFRPARCSSRKATWATRRFVIVSGFAAVTRGKRKLGVLTVGDCFGEMAYMADEGSPRSATVTTTSDCILMKISRGGPARGVARIARCLFDQQFVRVLVERLDAAEQASRIPRNLTSGPLCPTSPLPCPLPLPRPRPHAGPRRTHRRAPARRLGRRRDPGADARQHARRRHARRPGRLRLPVHAPQQALDHAQPEGAAGHRRC